MILLLYVFGKLCLPYVLCMSMCVYCFACTPYGRSLFLYWCVSNRGFSSVARDYVEACSQVLQLKDHFNECRRTLDAAGLCESASHSILPKYLHLRRFNQCLC